MSDETVTVSVSQGELRGKSRRTVYGFPYFSFQGIPYAASPVGPLRFKPPQPASPWDGVLDATKEGNVAAQLNIMTFEYEGHEDCLFLNVHTPKLPSDASADLLPVIFIIHGGGLACMSGNESWFGPDYIIRHGLVIVTFNYRLGALGFLSTGDSIVPGNMGFKDQVMALRWTRDNIKSFGGDPDNITISGGSAGAWSCHAFILSPVTKGLFKRAITQSGVAVGDGVCSDRIRARTLALAKHLGLQSEDSREVTEFLRKQPVEKLVNATMYGRTPDDVARGVLFPFVGTVEPEDAEGGAFLPREPADILRSGDFQHVPMISGVTIFEGSLFMRATTPETKYTCGGAENLRFLIPTNLRVPDADRDAVAEEIRQFYFGDRQVGPDTMKELWTMLGDLMFTYPAVRVAHAHSSKTAAPVYFYVFDTVAQTPLKEEFTQQLGEFAELFKVAGHGSDGRFFSLSSLLTDAPDEDSPDGKLSDKLTRLWANFIKTGVPTDSGVEVSWPSFSTKDGAYLYVHHGDFSVSHHPFAETFTFWEKLYNRYNS